MGVLEGKAVVVTGGGRGIGRAIAHAVAVEGAAVVVADMGSTLDGREPRPDIAHAVVGEVRATGGRAIAFTEDVTSLVGARRAIELALNEWSSFDGAVCCAGVLRHGPFHQLSEEDFDLVIRTHLKGHFAMFQSAFRVFTEQGRGGSLIGISSGYLSGDPLRSSYRAAKAAVVALTKSVAMAGATHGIRVNAIAPIANTRMTEASNLRFDSEPEDIAPVAVYLLSDRSEGVNGEVLGVSGRTINTWFDPQPSRSVRNPDRWHWEDVASAMPWLLQREAAAAPPPLTHDWNRR